ncbi:4-hydroxyphenylacetate decarboxylase activating enzyme [subsurface metagenome]
MIKGMVFNIERYAVHDGPGIRTIVFLVGCPLRCLWCQNPEGMELKPQLAFFPDKCTGCMRCLSVCPNKAIERVNEKILMNWDKCNRCLKCVKICPNEARKSLTKTMTSKEVLEEVIKDIPFYRRSGGGVTLSGGDPLFQVDFASEILRLCQKEKIHTVIETSGFIDWDDFVKILKSTDFIFFDIKHMNSIKHKYGTGVDNKKILENLRKITNLNKNIVIRICIIPGFNNSEKNIKDTAKFVKNLKNIRKIELLPYHNLGVIKYERMGKTYLLKDVNPPRDCDLVKLKNIIESYNIKCEIL